MGLGGALEAVAGAGATGAGMVGGATDLGTVGAGGTGGRTGLAEIGGMDVVGGRVGEIG